MTVIYMDNNATTRVAPQVVDAMVPYLSEWYGNPSSMHRFGGAVQKAIDQARERVTAFLGADTGEVVFTSCGTESDNTAIRGALEAQPKKRHVITTAVEHPAVLNVCRYLRDRGCRVTELGVDDDGRLDLDELRNALTDDTAVVSIMWANNETGVVFPIEEIAEIVKSRGAIVHCDAVQAAGKLPMDMSKSAIDLLSISGHKLHAPKGVGVLYVRSGARVAPFMRGGHQENGRRAGTENAASIIGLGVACELAGRALEEESARVCAMRDRLESGLLARCPDTRRNGVETPRLPNTTNISFAYVEGEAILLSVDEYGICLSSGSACTSGSLEPSHVLRAMGVPDTMLHGSVRFSLSRYNTDEEVDRVLDVFPSIIARLRDISPFVKK